MSSKGAGSKQDWRLMWKDGGTSFENDKEVFLNGSDTDFVF